MLFINLVCDRYGAGPREYAENLFLSGAELKKYIRKDYAFRRVHGVGHSDFPSLEAAQVEQELEKSSGYLTSVAGYVSCHLACSYGSVRTVMTRDSSLAKQRGFITRSIRNMLALPSIPFFPTDTESSILCKLSGLMTLFSSWKNSPMVRA